MGQKNKYVIYKHRTPLDDLIKVLICSMIEGTFAKNGMQSMQTMTLVCEGCISSFLDRTVPPLSWNHRIGLRFKIAGPGCSKTNDVVS